MSLVRIGRIGRTHGLRGEVTLDGASLSADELLGVRTFTWRGPRGHAHPVTLERARPAHARMLVAFAGYEDRDRAQALVGGELLAEPGRLPDPGPETAYAFQLVGLEVRDEGARALGRVTDVFSTGAHPIYVVQGDRELLIPASPGVIRRVDLEAGVITVALPAGLEEV